MANSNVPMFIQTIQAWPVQLTNTTGTTATTFLTAGANGSRVSALLATNTDTVTHDLQVFLVRSGVNYLLGTVTSGINSGNVNSSPTTNILGSIQIPGVSLDANGNPYLDLKAGDVLQVAALVTAASGKVINVIGYGGDF